jgi:hypothetical protein
MNPACSEKMNEFSMPLSNMWLCCLHDYLFCLSFQVELNTQSNQTSQIQNFTLDSFSSQKWQSIVPNVTATLKAKLTSHVGTNNKSASQDAAAILLPAGALESDSDATLKTNGLVVQRHVVARDHPSTKNRLGRVHDVIIPVTVHLMGVGRAAVLHEAIESNHLHVVGPVYEVLFGAKQVVHAIDLEEVLIRQVGISHDPFNAILEDDIADLEAARGHEILLLTISGSDDADAIGKATSEDRDAHRGEEILPDFRVA